MNRLILTIVVLLCFSMEVLASSRICPMLLDAGSMEDQVPAMEAMKDHNMEGMPCHGVESESSQVESGNLANCCNGDLSCKNGYCSLSAMLLSLPQIVSIEKQSISGNHAFFLPSNISLNDIRPPISA